jgi:mannose-6-phosphate isomerase
MFAAITNTPRDYAWGSLTAISEILGRVAPGTPEAELWLGTHPGSPSTLVGEAGTLADVLPEPLPFLLKVLAASAPLSLQAHPNLTQAGEGFRRENALGIAVDSPTRNYKDDQHKPELIYALSDGFRALCGFRETAAVRASLAVLDKDARVQPLLDRLTNDESLPAVFEWLINGGPEVSELVYAVSACEATGDEWDIVRLLADEHPGDPGIPISLLLNNVTLQAGEALFLTAGSIHAYLGGVGIELMAASDNVLRGGLTPKRIDVPELLSVLDFRPEAISVLHGEPETDGVVAFRPPVDEFSLRVVMATATVPLAGPAIVLCTSGEIVVTGATSNATIRRGESLFVSVDEGPLRIATDEGVLFVASVGN